MSQKQWFYAATLAAATVVVAGLVLAGSSGSNRDELIRGYQLEPIVEAIRTGDAEAFVDLMEEHNLCRPLRETPEECIGQEYVPAGRIWGALASPNLRSLSTLREWMTGYLQRNSGDLVLISSNAVLQENVLFLLFRLTEQRSPDALRPADAVAVWANIGRPSRVQQVFWISLDPDFVTSMLAGEDRGGIPGDFRNILYCDSNLLHGCP